MVLRAGFHGTVGQPSAQVIDGSLKFDGSKSTALKRTPGSDGNRKTWTWSAWVKKHKDSRSTLFSAGATSNDTGFAAIEIESDELLRYSGWNTLWKRSDDKFRDYNQFYHIVVAFDVTQGTASNRVRLYKNGVEITDLANNNSLSNTDYPINDNVIHYIGGIDGGGGENITFSDFNMTQVYLIDGQALGPEYFGFTDPLTNTWRPKKYTGTFSSSAVAGTGTLTNYDNNTQFPTYSNQGGGSSTIANVLKAFDGDNSTYADMTYLNGQYSRLTFENPITNVTNITIGYDGEGDPGYNGGNHQGSVSFNGSRQSIQLYNGSAITLNNLDFISQPGNGVCRLYDVTITTTTQSATELTLSGASLATGVNSFYLPMDGNSPIGQDKSGQGNDWTPVNFNGASNSIDKATGALPILNTTPSGVSASVGVRTDAYASNLVLALPLVGNKEDVHHLIKGSGSAKSVTGNGNVVANYSFSNFYSGSYYFDGSSDSLTAASSSDFGMGTGDFTIEAWVHPTQLYSSNFIVCLSGSDSVFGYGNDGTLNIQLPSSGAPALTQLGPKIANNKWNHFACVRESGNLRGYINGVLAATVSNATTNMGASGTATIGDHPSLSREIKGYLQDVRIYKGVAKYTSDFVPASTNPDILPDTPSGVSGGSKLAKITDGAVAFDGSGDYLSADSSDLAVGSGDFTLECFVYRDKSVSAFTNFIATRGAPGSATGYTFGAQASSNGYDVEFYTNSMTGINGGNQKITPNKWHHVVLTRSGTTLRSFVNGVLNTTTTNSQDFSNTSMAIGMTNDGSQGPMNGFLSNVRVIKGSIPTEYQTSSTTVDTKIFTPPTEPLTNVTNTKLLCCQSNTSAVDTTVVPGTAPNTRNWSARTNWNSGGTLTNASSYPLTAAFDGNLNTTFAMSYAGGMIWTAPSTISFSSSIEVYVNSSIGTGGQGFIATISGVQQSKVDLNAAGSWETLYSGSGTFDKLEITRNNGGNNNNLWISAIRVDGTVLVDAIAGHGDASATNFNPFNTDINTVRGQETGYCTANPLDKGALDLSDGNLRVERTSDTTDWETGRCTIRIPDTGKWYWEMTLSAGSNDGIYTGVGLQSAVLSQEITGFWGYNSGGYAIYNTSYASSRPSMSVGDTACVSFDRDNNKMWVLINGATTVYEGNPYSGTDPNSNWRSIPSDVYPVVGARSTGVGDYNFGQKPFKFPPPDGFQPLNAANARPVNVISRPDQYVGVTTYAGTGDAVSPRTVELPFAADLVWAKSRDRSSSHQLVDTVRGNNKVLISNSTDLERDPTSYFGGGGVASIDGKIISIESGSTNNANLNTDDEDAVVWSWKAGGSKGTFNVDDVGYASASDVNMNVGGLNSSFYNTSETWSNGLSALSGSSLTNPPNGFNGDPDSYADSTNGWSLDLSGHTFGTGAHTIEVKSGGATSFSVGGATGSGSLTDPGGGGAKVWTGTYTGEINSITSSASGASVYYVKIDGKILVNSGTNLSGLTQYPSISSTGCSVGTKQGFSILKWTGTSANGTLSHGLTKSPEFVIVKKLTGTGNWYCYHSGLTDATKYIWLNSTNSEGTQTAAWNSTDPTSSVLHLGAEGEMNANSNSSIAYLWHSVPGLQKFGTYEGNNNSNGPFVELGFNPAVIWTKGMDSNSHGWEVHWNSGPKLRQNPQSERLMLDQNVSKATTNHVDFLSNGFKIRNTFSGMNSTTDTYIYCAWADVPSFNLYGGQSNAR